MPLQYNEFYNKNTGLTIGVEKLLFSRQSEYQLVEVYETDTWGNLLTIDGMVMLSERDEFVYHEMLAHVAMFSHPAPKRVLIIGGGDGGTAITTPDKDRKSTRLNSSHVAISYAVFWLEKKKTI